MNISLHYIRYKNNSLNSGSSFLVVLDAKEAVLTIDQSWITVNMNERIRQVAKFPI